ncbi:MAG: hypothetical protein A2901_08900 [Elusimicrobia bacterium RIFCSPLOWO2_01_FULL_54_10]|nr:MAG: hypothetical protein A2901_08900 [Elusimicrobia bacterium RIFCSPLOWO2_01_FULL_54_10]
MNKKLPRFKSREEEAKFWETHSSSDYLEGLEDVTHLFTVAPELVHKIQQGAKKKLISLRLASWEIDRAKAIAKRRHMPYQVLLRSWIDEGLSREARSA